MDKLYKEENSLKPIKDELYSENKVDTKNLFMSEISRSDESLSENKNVYELEFGKMRKGLFDIEKVFNPIFTISNENMIVEEQSWCGGHGKYMKFTIFIPSFIIHDYNCDDYFDAIRIMKLSDRNYKLLKEVKLDKKQIINNIQTTQYVSASGKGAGIFTFRCIIDERI